MHAALACAPVASLLVAAGASASGLALHRADLAAAGAGAAVLGLVTERVQSRTARRALRQDRARMRGQLHHLQVEVAQLRRELATQPSVLIPQPPPSPVTGPLQIVVDAFDRAASPPTPRSLPILTSNRRGLQSCAPGLAGPSVPAISVPGMPVGQLPSQRPPATPITGLYLPPVTDPSLPQLEPGPAVPVLSSSVSQLAPGPREPVTGPIQLPIDLPRREPAGHDLFTPATRSREGWADVIDVRTIPAREPATASGLSAESIDALVYSSLAQAEVDGLTLTMEGPWRVAGSLFEPVVPSENSQAPGSVLADRVGQATAAARQASRSSGAALPPSPFFTPGAFERESA